MLVERDFILFPQVFITHEAVVVAKKLPYCLHRTIAKRAVYWVAVDISVFHDQIGFHTNKALVRVHFCKYMWLPMVGIKNDHTNPVFDYQTDFIDRSRIGRTSLDQMDPRMLQCLRAVG